MLPQRQRSLAAANRPRLCLALRQVTRNQYAIHLGIALELLPLLLDGSYGLQAYLLLLVAVHFDAVVQIKDFLAVFDALLLSQEVVIHLHERVCVEIAHGDT